MAAQVLDLVDLEVRAAGTQRRSLARAGERSAPRPRWRGTAAAAARDARPRAGTTSTTDIVAFGDRAGLVEGDARDRRGRLERRGVAHEDAGACGSSERHGERERRRQTECARAGHDEDGDGRQHGRAQRTRLPATSAAKQPAADSTMSSGKGRRRPVGEALHGRLGRRASPGRARRSVPGETTRRLRHPVDQSVVDDERPREHDGAALLLDWRRLPVSSDSSTAAAPSTDLAVGGDPLARPSKDDVALPSSLGAYAHPLTGLASRRPLGLECEQLPDILARPSTPDHLEIAAQRGSPR